MCVALSTTTSASTSLTLTSFGLYCLPPISREGTTWISRGPLGDGGRDVGVSGRVAVMVGVSGRAAPMVVVSVISVVSSSLLLAVSPLLFLLLLVMSWPGLGRVGSWSKGKFVPSAPPVHSWGCWWW